MKQKHKLEYYLKIIKLKPDFELVWMDSCPGNNGYSQDLSYHILDEDSFHKFGVLIITSRCICQANNSKLNNTRNKYARHCIVGVIENESTPESRLALLHAFQAFMKRPKDNK